MHMEDEFDVEIPDDDAENIRLVQDAINYIQQHLTSDRDGLLHCLSPTMD